MKQFKGNTFFRKAGTLACCLVFFLVSAAAADFPEDVLKAKQSIKDRMLVSHVDFLASKYCRGRETGEPGMDVAEQYIASVFRGIGAVPIGSSGSYFQEVKLKTVSLSDRIHLKIIEQTGSGTLINNAELEWDFLPIQISAEKEVTAPLVFAGYGITAPEHNYDDYKTIDARGKIVLVMRHEPGENNDASPFDGRKNSNHGTFLAKILNAQKHGAMGILFVTDPLNHEDLSLRSGSFMSGTNWPSLKEKHMKAENDEDLKYEKTEPRMQIIGQDFGVGIPAVQIDGRLAAKLLGGENALRNIQGEIDKVMKPRSFPINGKTISMEVYFHNKPVKADNIAAKIEGSDPVLKDEVVIIGAHYDHEGKDNHGEIFHGADDNASGTAAVLELARAIQSLETKPKRTIVFILWTAEEKGLLGARYYVENPLFPLEKTLAYINLDMLSRNSVDQLGLVGKYQYPKLFQVADQINKQSTNFELNFNVDEFIRNSDHFPFMRKKIPSLFFNSGTHPELHTPRDTVGRMVVQKFEKAAHLAFLTLWETANLPAGTNLRSK
jgi:hypothetical protein